MSINHRNFAQTTLASAITDTGGTSITVTSEASFPAVQFIISVDTEAMLVTNVDTTTWTVTRGYEGSTAATHLNGAAIYHDISAAEVDARVVGPASAVDAHAAVFDSTTGKLIKDGGAFVAGVWLETDVNGDLMPGIALLADVAAAYSAGAWTPVLGGFTIVGANPAVIGSYIRIGNLVFISCVIHAGAGGNTSVASTIGTSYITGIPTAASKATCQVTLDATAFLGNGFITPGTGIMSCTFTAQTADIYITATYAA